MQVLIFYLYQLMSAKAPQHPMVARASRSSVQSQNVEGWAIETLLQNCHIDIGLDSC